MTDEEVAYELNINDPRREALALQTEMGFLVELLLKHKLPKVTRDLVGERIKVVEKNLAPRPHQVVSVAPMQTRQLPPEIASQSPSMQAIMLRNQDLLKKPVGDVMVAPPPEAPLPVAVIAQTPAAMAAMTSRQQAISESMSGKVDKVTGRPRKF